MHHFPFRPGAVRASLGDLLRMALNTLPGIQLFTYVYVRACTCMHAWVHRLPQVMGFFSNFFINLTVILKSVSLQ